MLPSNIKIGCLSCVLLKSGWHLLPSDDALGHDLGGTADGVGLIEVLYAAFKGRVVSLALEHALCKGLQAEQHVLWSMVQRHAADSRRSQ